MNESSTTMQIILENPEKYRGKYQMKMKKTLNGINPGSLTCLGCPVDV